MGVKDLWTVVAPTARPTQLASLNRKRLAVDASIWIYQFLKAVRDKEGNALRNSHVVGFFRRICKLLYFGIKPVFVFDGGAPILKRETVRKRARRREGRGADATRTAGRLLAVQVQRAAEEEDRRRRAARERSAEEEIPDDKDLVYVDELGMSAAERQRTRGFRKKDQYHLPELDVSIENMGAPNDPRIMSQAELEDYARQFHSGEDVNLYDFSKIDFESPFFLSLPPGDRYNILNAARLRSRLRMGYSKEQLDGMFPDRMAFSKFQIERVKERNELTQRLMHINGMVESFLDQGGRIAGEKGKEYILVKNDGVDGGWALGVVSNKEGRSKENAIDLEDEEKSVELSQESEEDEFEDVAVEGLNRLPKSLLRKRKAPDDLNMSYDDVAEQIARKRREIYEARKTAAEKQSAAREAHTKLPRNSAVDDTNQSMFVPEDGTEEDDDLFEDVLPADFQDEDDDELQRAIAMSLEKPDETDSTSRFLAETAGLREDEYSDDDLDLQAALAESRRSKHASAVNVKEKSPPKAALQLPKFDGPLPFESINLGKSILGKKKAKQVEENISGGFERDLGEATFRKERPPQPMPDWFNTASTANDMRDGIDTAMDDDHITYQEAKVGGRETLREHHAKEVIDLEKEDTLGGSQAPIEIDDEDEETQQSLHDSRFASQYMETESPSRHHEPEMLVDEEELAAQRKKDEEVEAQRHKEEAEREKRYELGRQIAAAYEPEEPRMGKVAEKAQAQPPTPTAQSNFVPEHSKNDRVAPEEERAIDQNAKSDFDEVNWSESEWGSPPLAQLPVQQDADSSRRATQDDDEGEEFEDVEMTTAAPELDDDVSAFQKSIAAMQSNNARSPTPSNVHHEDEEEEFGYLSESEEELMRQLAIEAEEHARFASSLNPTGSKDQAQAVRDYEAELKALRNQQKKDRRDADEVTQTMIQECQALLRLFGLPYITAPMEAEAQCAELVSLGLVDGIVTDDSDIFLFGGTRVYKNMFNAAKFVECYLASDLEKEFGLERRKLIRFAHLLGSDYTEGIPGVGPVTALEIITDFNDLELFKEWCDRVQVGRPQDMEDQLNTPFRRKFRNTVQKRLFLPPSFPDSRVDEAYLHPDVDSNPEEFVWGVPDLDKLRGFLMATIGWSQERTDEILVPVVRDVNRREVEGTQANITHFFQGGVGTGAKSKEGSAPRNRAGKESGRMSNAFKRLRSEQERRRRRDGDVENLDHDNVEAVVTEKRTALANGENTRGRESTSKATKRTKGVKRSAGKDLVDDDHEADDITTDNDGVDTHDNEEDEDEGFAQDEAPRKRTKAQGKRREKVRD